MAMIQVANVQEAKSGRSLRVLLGTQWYGAYKDSGISKGMMIDPVIETLEKGGPWIVKYVQSTNATPPASAPESAPPSSPAPGGVAPQYVPSVAPWWAQMASNTIAHAIQAGKLEKPNQVSVWFNAVKMAAEGKTSVEDDDVPF